jgi:hypothetical protein
MRSMARRRMPGCLFCGGEAPPVWYRVACDQPRSDHERVAGQERYDFPERLCLRHFGILYRAGERGRVHLLTGKRWWLLGWLKPGEGGQASG